MPLEITEVEVDCKSSNSLLVMQINHNALRFIYGCHNYMWIKANLGLVVCRNVTCLKIAVPYIVSQLC